MNAKLILSDEQLQSSSCEVLLECLKRYNDIPALSCQEGKYIHNQKLEHQCILTFNDDKKNIENIWGKIKKHIPYLNNAKLHIDHKYNGPIQSFLEYSNKNDSLSDLPPFFLT